ncbi:hypothetical protein V2J09_015005 [Rumex salicifolius]
MALGGGGGDGQHSRFAAVERNYSSTPAATTLDAAASTSGSVAGGRGIEEDPILLLALFHKAIKAQLDELGRAVAEGGGGGGDLVADLKTRFEFLKQVYKYHCAAEDEVIFVALDVYMKNIACSYCLEHKSIDDLFESIFSSLNVLSKSEQGIEAKELQELVFCVGALKKAICKHMLKEEEQVFPLLMKQFSGDEQASLVWQVICSVPVMVLVDLFSWLTCFLSPEEHRDLKHCIKKVVPEDTLLQGLVFSWLDNTTQHTFGASVQYGKLGQCIGAPENLGCASDLFLSQSISRINSQCVKENFLYASAPDRPVDGLRLWHAVIKQDFKDILDELHEMKSSCTFSTLDSVIVQIKFLADLLVFYSDVLDKIFYPWLEDLSGTLASFLPFFDKDEVEGLQDVLYHANRTVIYVQRLLSKIEPFAIRITQQLSFQEAEVFPLIISKCNHETQVQLLFLSLHMMPLGLLKCVITWFSPHLPKDKLMYILHTIKESGFLDESFAFLLHEWVRIGYSGKTSVKDLQEMFKSNVSYLGKQIKEDPNTCRKSDNVILGPGSVMENEVSYLDSSTSGFGMLEKNAMLYSREINMRVHFPQTSTLLHPILECPPSAMPDSLDPRPIDHIYYFHKAVKRELEYLVHLSDTLPENFGLLFEICRRFGILRVVCQLHREAEDAVAFPALEAKETGHNISLSYSIDHKLEKDYFKEISDVLSKMSELHIVVSSEDPLNLAFKEFLQLSLRLQDDCRSLQKILGDHNNREEIELLPVFRKCFSIEEQEKIVGQMLGRSRAELLQEMIMWLMESLNPEEQHAIMSFWRKATKNTMFDEWLAEWWEGTCEHNMVKVVKESDDCSSESMELMELVWKYLSCEKSGDREGIHLHEESVMDASSDSMKLEERTGNPHEKKDFEDLQFDELSRSNKKQNVAKTYSSELVEETVQVQEMKQKLWQQKGFVTMNEQELEATILRVSRDSSLDIQTKTRINQFLHSSNWNRMQQQSIPEKTTFSQAQSPSYRDQEKSVFGCKHYKQNCKLVTPCCKQIFTCRRCHDEISDHQVDRKSITQMMCMKCLVIQPIGPSCVSCQFSMAKHYCRICRLFDDDRLGRGLGIDFFHCMKCNACMSPTLLEHVCREKCLEDVCPICHEDMFTSSNPVKALKCGHLMHSSCFKDYTSLHYACPVCCKSLGDLKVYFAMLDAYLAEERLPDEYRGQTQAILCNDCGGRGIAPFHFIHHKCTYCGSYNTKKAEGNSGILKSPFFFTTSLSRLHLSAITWWPNSKSVSPFSDTAASSSGLGIDVPNAHAGVASDLRGGEEHDVMVCRRRYRSVLRPVISKVVNNGATAGLVLDDRLSHESVRVVWRRHYFNVRSFSIET